MTTQRIVRRRSSAAAAPEATEQQLTIQPEATPGATPVAVAAPAEVETTEPEAPEVQVTEPEAPEPELEPVAPETPELEAPEVQAPEAALATPNRLSVPGESQLATQAAHTAAITLPDVDAPALNSASVKAYKLGMKSTTFITSIDGGQTNVDSGVSAVAGCPMDLQLLVTESNSGDYTHNIRLRLGFMQIEGDNGEPCELNLNACNTGRDGSLYVTGSVRSLLASLLHISECEDDMAAFCEGARFRIRPGDASKSRSGRATTFINVDVVNNASWFEINGRDHWNQSPGTLARLIEVVTKLKASFNAAGLLLHTPAVVGAELLETEAAIDTSYTTV